MTAVDRTSGSDESHAHDLNGNRRMSGPKPSDPANKKYRYSYDAWRRVVKVEESPTAMTSWTALATFQYNGLNERVIKIDVAAAPDVQYDYY